MVFPKWVDKLTPLLLWGGVIGLLGTIFVFWYWFSPKNLYAGYQPTQPVSYSHQLHAGQLGLDCRYCHYTVEEAAHAAIPPTEVCMNCHGIVKTNSVEIQKLKTSVETDTPIEWVKVHNLPDYAYFDHSRHIQSGVGCAECHGRIDQMEIVYQDQSLSMGWCLECHRDPASRLRPAEFITEMDWVADDPVAVGNALIAQHNIAPRQDCNTCHR